MKSKANCDMQLSRLATRRDASEENTGTMADPASTVRQGHRHPCSNLVTYLIIRMRLMGDEKTEDMPTGAGPVQQGACKPTTTTSDVSAEPIKQSKRLARKQVSGRVRWERECSGETSICLLTINNADRKFSMYWCVSFKLAIRAPLPPTAAAAAFHCPISYRSRSPSLTSPTRSPRSRLMCGQDARPKALARASRSAWQHARWLPSFAACQRCASVARDTSAAHSIRTARQLLCWGSATAGSQWLSLRHAGQGRVGRLLHAA